jgi:four helix bundle protein
MKSHNYHELKIWQNPMDLVIKVYKLTSKFPVSEKYGLISQINRAAISIPSNIAEGCSRTSNKDFQHFLSIALGSAFELETQLILSSRLEYISEIELNEISNNLIPLQKMINKLHQSLNPIANI